MENARITRWILALRKLNSDTVYVKGKENVVTTHKTIIEFYTYWSNRKTNKLTISQYNLTTHREAVEIDYVVLTSR